MSAKLCQLLEPTFSDGANQRNFFTGRQVEDIRKMSELRELPILGVPGESCKTNLFFGFFFDGTRNNYVQAEPWKNHSNVARLYDCYPGLSVPGVLPKSTDWVDKDFKYTHFFKVYVPGVGSTFGQVHDSGNGTDRVLGAASAAFGERRIVWALVQAINNVHRYFVKAPLVPQSEQDALLAHISLTKDVRRAITERNWWSRAADINHVREEFRKILQRLHLAVAQHWPAKTTCRPAKIDPAIVKTIYVSTFGFSRGAAEARVFVNWLQSLCKLDAQLSGRSDGMSLGGFNVEFDFLGIFDTVASVGFANTIGFFDGHGAWADTQDSLRVPSRLKCLHLVAAHEQRRSFPVDSVTVNGLLPEGCQEIVVPGVHSDLGGGYCPREQGRGTETSGDDMLSRIPLLMMYKAARLNGVPLKLELSSEAAKAKFALKEKTIIDFNAYLATCSVKEGPLHRIMREQARKQMEWRLLRRVHGQAPLQNSASFLRASSFDQNDLYSAGCEFEEEIAQIGSWMKGQKQTAGPSAHEPGIYDGRDDDWREIATWWEKQAKPSAEVIRFFDDYVHDSRAWFKLAPGSPDNEEAMHAKLANWVRIRKAPRSPLPVVTGKSDARFAPGLTPEEERAADEYAKTGKIPRMTNSGREPLTAGAGYLRFRKIYDGADWELGAVLARAAGAAARAGKDVAESTIDGIKKDGDRIYTEAANWGWRQVMGDRDFGH